MMERLSGHHREIDASRKVLEEESDRGKCRQWPQGRQGALSAVKRGSVSFPWRSLGKNGRLVMSTRPECHASSTI